MKRVSEKGIVVNRKMNHVRLCKLDVAAPYVTNQFSLMTRDFNLPESKALRGSLAESRLSRESITYGCRQSR